MCIVGAIPPDQGGHQVAHVARSSRADSHFCPYQRRKTARCERAGRTDRRTRRLLRDGSGLHGFRSPVRPASNKGRSLSSAPKILFRFARVHSLPVDDSTGVCSDQIIRLTIYRSHQAYPDRFAACPVLRRGDRPVFCFPHQQLSASRSYHRPTLQESLAGRTLLQVIKQHLRIKRFIGTSANAVKTQVWIALCVYVLVAILKKQLYLPGGLAQTSPNPERQCFRESPSLGTTVETRRPRLPLPQQTRRAGGIEEVAAAPGVRRRTLI